MPVAEIDDKGTHLFYEDSGVPASAESTGGIYTTLICVHGTSFHGTFRHLLPLADRHTLRIVIVNRRDYPGSSSSTPEVLEQLRSNDTEKQAQGVAAFSYDISGFLHWFITTHRTPPISRDSEGDDIGSGGVALLGWSSGNPCLISLLGHIDELSAETTELLNDHLRTIVFYDSPLYPYGIIPPRNLYRPFLDKFIPKIEDRILHFNTWVSTYFTHPNLSSRSITGLTDKPPLNPPPHKTPTVERMTQEEFDAVTCPGALKKIDGSMRFLNPEVYRCLVDRALFDQNLASTVLPKLRVVTVWCRESIWETIWAGWEMERRATEARDRGIVGRRFEIRDMEGNHFAHWDEPEKTLRFFSTII